MPKKNTVFLVLIVTAIIALRAAFSGIGQDDTAEQSQSESEERALPVPLGERVVSCGEDCLLDHLSRTHSLNATAPQVIINYGWGGRQPMDSSRFHPNSTILLVLLTPDSPPPLYINPFPSNQIVMAPPNEFRLNSLFATNNFFEVQLVFRFGELIHAVRPKSLEDLLGGLLSMGRETFISFPCGTDGVAAISKAVNATRLKQNDLGVREVFSVDVQKVTSFQQATVNGSGTCEAELLRVRILEVHRGAMLKWCYYPKWVRFITMYKQGEKMAMKPIDPSPRNWKLRVFKKWFPNINLADLVGWGINEMQRELLWLNVLKHGNSPDPAVQNWLVTNGASLHRIDGNDNSAFAYPVGANYLQFMRIQLCLPSVAGSRRFKQVYESDTRKGKPELYYMSTDDHYRVSFGSWRKRQDSDKNYSVLDCNSTTYAIHDECEACGSCLRHNFRKVKMVWHTPTSLPPKECWKCYACAREKILSSGMAVGSQPFEGCTDVEGISDDGVGTDQRRCFPGKMPADRWVITQPSWPHKGFFPKLLPGDENPDDKIKPGDLNAVK